MTRWVRISATAFTASLYARFSLRTIFWRYCSWTFVIIESHLRKWTVRIKARDNGQYLIYYNRGVIGSTVMTKRNIFRRAGDKLMDMDDSYADKVREFIDYREKKPREGFIPTVRKTAAYVGGSRPREVKVEFEEGSNPSGRQKAYAKAAEVGIIGAGLGVRYGLPAAGVTLAGKGIMDLTAQFSSMGDQQTGSEIGMI